MLEHSGERGGGPASRRQKAEAGHFSYLSIVFSVFNFSASLISRFFLHTVNHSVQVLLTQAGGRCPQPFTVIYWLL